MAVTPATAQSMAPTGLDPRRIARWVRRATVVFAVVMATWFLLQFSSRWVPIGMNTNPEMPAGSWLICDRWSIGLRVGSDVFVKTHFGELLTRVSRLTDDEVFVQNPNDEAGWPDSDEFGGLPLHAVESVVIVSFATEPKKSKGDDEPGKPRGK